MKNNKVMVFLYISLTSITRLYINTTMIFLHHAWNAKKNIKTDNVEMNDIYSDKKKEKEKDRERSC